MNYAQGQRPEQANTPQEGDSGVFRNPSTPARSAQTSTRAANARARNVERAFGDLLQRADIQLHGARPHDVRIKDHAFYSVGLSRGLTGLREAYVNGLWDTAQLDVLTYKLLRSGLHLPSAGFAERAAALIVDTLKNRQRRRGSVKGVLHYELGDDLFFAMLDPRLIYSCAYWKDARTLEQAQEHKLALVCRKLGLKPGMRVLDVGCGWGGFARFAAERYGVDVVGITLSADQARVAKKRCAGLPIEVRYGDYRDLRPDSRSFDAVVSLGMFEHVGLRNHRRYLAILREQLTPGGLMLLQTIGGNESMRSYDRWMQRHIFPNAFIPSARQIADAAEGQLVMEDWHNFGADYDRTLMAWHENFQRHWSELADRYGERFRRMWSCYLLTCAGAFRARSVHLWQIVWSPDGREGGYVSFR